MRSKDSVSFSIYIPIRHQAWESSHLNLYYGGAESKENRSHEAFEREHAANGDLKERLTVLTRPQKGSGPAKYVWGLDEEMPDALWVHEIFTELESTHRGELREFLARCVQDAMRDPAKPFRAVFSTSESHDF